MIRLVSILVCMYRCDLWPALAISPPIRCYLVNTRQLRISQSVPKEFPERIPIIVVSFVSLVPLESGCHEGNRIWPEYLCHPMECSILCSPKADDAHNERPLCGFVIGREPSLRVQ